MVVKPSECSQGDADFSKAFMVYEQHIDSHLKIAWWTGCQGLIIPYLKCPLGANEWAVQEQIKRQYSDAGWIIEFDTGDYRGDAYIRIKLKE